jgi:hypothetical protein
VKGRIYEEKCDVSPDGQLLLYFILQGSRSGTEFTHAWTAISRVPWLEALVLWPQATTYGGGGRFIGNRSVALRGVLDAPLKDFPLRGIEIVDGETSVQQTTGEVPDTDWCGRDQEDRVIFTRAGKLFRRMKRSDALVADFTELTPNPQPAPEWAGRSL